MTLLTYLLPETVAQDVVRRVAPLVAKSKCYKTELPAGEFAELVDAKTLQAKMDAQTSMLTRDVRAHIKSQPEPEAQAEPVVDVSETPTEETSENESRRPRSRR